MKKKPKVEPEQMEFEWKAKGKKDPTSMDVNRALIHLKRSVLAVRVLDKLPEELLKNVSSMAWAAALTSMEVLSDERDKRLALHELRQFFGYQLFVATATCERAVEVMIKKGGKSATKKSR